MSRASRRCAPTLADQLDSGADLGASVAVFLHGDPVVDIWGGWADAEKTRPWERDTITNVWSTTKTMTFLVALMLYDRRELDFHAPVATYWPEFAANGKEHIEVRHVMGHTAGLSGWDEPLTAEDLADWEKCTAALAAQAPWWEPGMGSGYHAVTQGYLIGEIVRRITGESIGSWFASEVAKPLDADFHIGLPASEDHRVSNVIPPPPIDVTAMEGQVSELMLKTFMNPPIDATMAHHEWWRRAEIPAANGQGNARSVAAIQSIIAGRGEARGVRLLSAEGTDPIFEVQADGIDKVLGVQERMGMGYGLSNPPEMPIGPRACYWGGYGGSVIVNDQDAELSVCYVMNRMESGLVGDLRGTNILAATVEGLALGAPSCEGSTASASISTFQAGSSNPATTTIVAAGPTCPSSSPCTAPTASASPADVTYMRVRTTSSNEAPASARAAPMISKHRRAWGPAPSGQRPPSTTGPVPETTTRSPTRTARLNPIVGSKGEPEEMR